MTLVWGGNETTPNLKEESATSSICVCVCVKQCVLLLLLLLLLTWNNVLKKKKTKNQPKKTIHKTMNFGSTNWLNRKRSLETQ